MWNDIWDFKSVLLYRALQCMHQWLIDNKEKKYLKTSKMLLQWKIEKISLKEVVTNKECLEK